MTQGRNIDAGEEPTQEEDNMTDPTRTKKINLGSSNHPDNFVTEEEFADIVAEAVAYGEEAECAAGTCAHYTCTEGRALDEWDEPEPTAWDYESEIDRGGDSDEFLDYEADRNNEAAANADLNPEGA
jgi:hypothetical protein